MRARSIRTSKSILVGSPMIVSVKTAGCAWALTWAVEELVGIVQTTGIVVGVAHIIVIVVMMVGRLEALSGPM